MLFFDDVDDSKLVFFGFLVFALRRNTRPARHTTLLPLLPYIVLATLAQAIVCLPGMDTRISASVRDALGFTVFTSVSAAELPGMVSFAAQLLLFVVIAVHRPQTSKVLMLGRFKLGRSTLSTAQPLLGGDIHDYGTVSESAGAGASRLSLSKKSKLLAVRSTQASNAVHTVIFIANPRFHPRPLQPHAQQS